MEAKNGELSKIKRAFSKVRSDMKEIKGSIDYNVSLFEKDYDYLSTKLSDIFKIVNSHAQQFDKLHSSHISTSHPDKISSLKEEVKHLKEEISILAREHTSFLSLIEIMKSSNSEVDRLSKKFKSSELEIFALKEKLKDKDLEIKEIKKLNQKILKAISNLSGIELKLSDHTRKKK